MHLDRLHPHVARLVDGFEAVAAEQLRRQLAFTPRPPHRLQAQLIDAILNRFGLLLAATDHELGLLDRLRRHDLERRLDAVQDVAAPRPRLATDRTPGISVLSHPSGCLPLAPAVVRLEADKRGRPVASEHDAGVERDERPRVGVQLDD